MPFNYAGEGLAGIDPDEVEIGWYLLPEYWGRGFAVEAAPTVLRDALRRLGFQDVVAYMRPANAASIRVAEHLAMEPGREARARNGDRVLVYRATPEAS